MLLDHGRLVHNDALETALDHLTRSSDTHCGNDAGELLNDILLKLIFHFNELIELLLVKMLNLLDIVPEEVAHFVVEL